MKLLLLFLLSALYVMPVLAQQTVVQYLSGTDKDHTVLWDFYCNKGYKSGQWAKIPVPSNWELQGFGTYNYYKDTDNPDEIGLYKFDFNVNTQAYGKRVFIVFEGVMTDTEVKINGQVAGPVHQGGFYRFKYDITTLLKPGTRNFLEVRVSKRSGNESVNNAERKADFWLFGGIYRPVYLEIVPQTYIDRIAINAQASGSLVTDVYAANLQQDNIVTGQIQSLSGENIGQPFTAASTSANKLILQQQFNNIKAWNPESPQLYNLLVSIKDNKGAIIHQVKQRFGFRTMEFRPQDGIYVNNSRVILKGVNRHSIWPESGRTLSKELSLLDVRLIKEMNMNAVRMSHYPPDQHFLDVCDSLGLFVLDELTGWQAKYDTVVGRKLVKELVLRDVNHPSIIIWDNGNEGGWNTALDGDYGLYDPQKRLVIHPWENFNGTDTKHYPDYNYVANSVLYGKEVFFPTEFMHGNYDGGGAAALSDYWNLMLQHPYFAGGFLWVFCDEGVARTDKNGQMDTAKDSAPDGVVGPHREKEGSFFAVKEIWSPVVISQKHIEPTFNGSLPVENRYIYTNLNQCSFNWKLVSFPLPVNKTYEVRTYATGKASVINLSPGEKGFLRLNLPPTWYDADAIYLTAIDAYGKEIFTWTWAISSPKSVASIALKTDRSVEKPVTATMTGKLLSVKSGSVVCYFDTVSGYLSHLKKGQQIISLNNGPMLAGADMILKSFKYYHQKDRQYFVECKYMGAKGWFNVRWSFIPGKPIKLDYQYNQKEEADHLGITFNYPEDKVTGMKWLGRGPYRVWKNRMEGQQFGLWHKEYNNTITGETWQYPEFKGYHAQLYWVTLENKESSFIIYTEDENIFLQMYKPQISQNARETLKPAFPVGNIGFLNAIAPVGTRFQQPALLGPQSQKNMQLNYKPISGTLWFDFN